MGTPLGFGSNGRLTMEASSGEVLGLQVCTGERPEKQSRVPMRGSREFTASVQSSGWWRGVRRGTRAAVNSGSTTASTAAQWRRRVWRRKKGCTTGGGAAFIASRGGWQRRCELRLGRWWW
jgi:hypothetical protein